MGVVSIISLSLVFHSLWDLFPEVQICDSNKLSIYPFQEFGIEFQINEIETCVKNVPIYKIKEVNEVNDLQITWGQYLDRDKSLILKFLFIPYRNPECKILTFGC